MSFLHLSLKSASLTPSSKFAKAYSSLSAQPATSDGGGEAKITLEECRELTIPFSGASAQVSCIWATEPPVPSPVSINTRLVRAQAAPAEFQPHCWCSFSQKRHRFPSQNKAYSDPPQSLARDRMINAQLNGILCVRRADRRQDRHLFPHQGQQATGLPGLVNGISLSEPNAGTSRRTPKTFQQKEPRSETESGIIRRAMEGRGGEGSV